MMAHVRDQHWQAQAYVLIHVLLIMFVHACVDHVVSTLLTCSERTPINRFSSLHCVFNYLFPFLTLFIQSELIEMIIASVVVKFHVEKVFYTMLIQEYKTTRKCLPYLSLHQYHAKLIYRLALTHCFHVLKILKRVLSICLFVCCLVVVAFHLSFIETYCINHPIRSRITLLWPNVQFKQIHDNVTTQL